VSFGFDAEPYPPEVRQGDLRTGQPSPFNALPWLTLCLIAVGVVYALVLSITRPAVLERAPALLEGEEALAVDPMPAS
jgi:hypothetical protein